MNLHWLNPWKEARIQRYLATQMEARLDDALNLVHQTADQLEELGKRHVELVQHHRLVCDRNVRLEKECEQKDRTILTLAEAYNRLVDSRKNQ